MEFAPDTRGRAVVVRTLEIGATPEAPTVARRWLDGIDELPPLGQVAFDVRLLVTELVVNCVRHAGLSDRDTITVSLELAPERLRVEVRDEGPGFRIPARPQKVRIEGGRGLQIVDAIAKRWGVEHNGRSGVWFEIDLDGARQDVVGAHVPRGDVRGLVP